MIIRHFNMSYAMTVMTNWNEIFYFAIFSVAINMMNYKYSFISYSTIIALLFIYFPSITLITSRHLFFNRFFIPTINSTFIRTKFSFFKKIFWAIKRNIAIYTQQCFPRFVGYFRTFFRTMILFFSSRFFAYKFLFTNFTNIFHGFFKTVNSTAFVSTCFVSMLITKWYRECFIADRTYFFNNFHKGILV